MDYTCQVFMQTHIAYCKQRTNVSWQNISSAFDGVLLMYATDLGLFYTAHIYYKYFFIITTASVMLSMEVNHM